MDGDLYIADNNFDDVFRQVEKSIRHFFTQKQRKNSVSPYILDVRKAINLDSEFTDIEILEKDPLGIDGTNNSFSNSSIYRVKNLPEGFYIVTNSLSLESQITWATKCCRDYSKAYHTNLSNLCRMSSIQSEKTADNLINSDIWEQTVSQQSLDFNKIRDLRWSSLGYHYDWTARMYKKNDKSDFPEDLALLVKKLANLTGNDITAEAAIVNYYPVGTSMLGHLDDAEHAMNEPIVSISLGCDAIFLLGGRTKSVIPTPILIKSGDVIIMSGESRYCYHGIAYVLPQSEFHNINDSIMTIENKHVVEYLRNFRINLNVRRVALPDVEWIDKCGSGAMKNSNVNTIASCTY